MNEVVFIEQSPSQGREHRVEPSATIGREGCDVILTDPDVSRRHAEIRVAGDAVEIEDLGSTNGTYVNGERIGAPRRLGDGDEVQIGSTVWRLQAPAAGATKLASTLDAGATKLGQATTLRPSAPAEPTAAEPVAAAEPPTAERAPAPAPAAPEPAAPAPAASAPAPPAPAPAAPEPAAGPRRGDVPAPDFAPSAIRRVVPGPDVKTPFDPSSPRRRRGSAATRLGATLMAGAVVAATTAGVVLYYITEPFK